MDQEKLNETANVIFNYLWGLDGMERFKSEYELELMAYGRIRDPEEFKRRFNEIMDQNLIHPIEGKPSE